MICDFHRGLPSHPRPRSAYPLPIAAGLAAEMMEAKMAKKDFFETTAFAAILILGLPLAIVMSALLAGQG